MMRLDGSSISSINQANVSAKVFSSCTRLSGLDFCVIFTHLIRLSNSALISLFLSSRACSSASSSSLNCWAFARLSTAIAKKTLSKVSDKQVKVFNLVPKLLSQFRYFLTLNNLGFVSLLGSFRWTTLQARRCEYIRIRKSFFGFNHKGSKFRFSCTIQSEL